ncbi:hypothetical protein QBC35DRAFT_28935 [Podospora australis]|uniref:Uncharacterized protein n=1 Tax=Podospora australis TaxID=1536484 RepID=A0AAN6WRR4_9PEZI|nr:hypothetical protein QBC35DRAFT_28935 [Podospora australis]
MVVQNAVQAAEAGEVQHFERFLFLLGLSTAHELIHMFVGYMTGNDTTETPEPVQ